MSDKYYAFYNKKSIKNKPSIHKITGCGQAELLEQDKETIGQVEVSQVIFQELLKCPYTYVYNAEIDCIQVNQQKEDYILMEKREELMYELIDELNKLDSKTLRPLRAIQSGFSTQEDIDMLASIEEQAESIRAKIKTLKESIEED